MYAYKIKLTLIHSNFGYRLLLLRLIDFQWIFSPSNQHYHFVYDDDFDQLSISACVCVCMIIQNDDANWTCDNHTTLWDIFSIIYFLIFWNTIFKLFTKLLAKRWKLLRLVNDKKCRRNPIVRYIVIFSFFAV